MKQLAYSLLLAALLAGCAGGPSKDAMIEDRAVKAEAAKDAGGKAVETGRVGDAGAPIETRQVSGAAVVETTSKAGEGVKTSGASAQPVSAKSTDAVHTRGVAEPSSEVKPLADGKGAAQAVPADAGASGAGGKAAGAQDGTTLPYSGGQSLNDLKDPNSPLAKRRVLFDFDSAAIRDEFRTVLEAHAQYMKTNKGAKVILQGHADERGSREYNLALGQRRSESVFKALNLLGVADSQMEAVSLGEEKPVATGHDEESWQQNRRAEILYDGE